MHQSASDDGIKKRDEVGFRELGVENKKFGRLVA
jgi:hypothetical protein